MYPYNCARVVRAAGTTTPSKAREVSQGKTEARENYDAKAKTTKSKGDEADSPGSLPGDSSSSLGKTLAAATRPAPMEQITLESTASKGKGFGRRPRGGM